MREPLGPLDPDDSGPFAGSSPYRCGGRTYDRRQALAFAAAFAMLPADAQAVRLGDDAYEAIQRFTAGRPMSPGRVHLDLPDIAQNGGSVRMAVSVQIPASEEIHVVDLLVVADGDPGGRVALFHFSPDCGAARVITRIRLHATQRVIAVAKMSDGAFYVGRKQVKVALGGWSW